MIRASGSSSSSRFSWSFDVFLSFRGEDTRSNFTSHINMALRQRGINVFIDNELSMGEEISASLLEAIEKSKISIVIISENYASSSWCLNELVEIIMCNKFRGQIVLPIFYKVDPSQVRKQSGTFGEAFAKLEVRFFNNMQAWREALTTLSNMSGRPVLQNDDEANLIQIIVQDVWEKLNRATMQLDVAEYPVGIDRRLMNLLPHVLSDGISMVGLYGIGGLGKTTLAKALYNIIADDFEGCCFLADIRELSNQCGGLVKLQKKLLREILMDDSIKVSNLHRGINIIRDRLCSKKILLILDDVDTHEQLRALAGKHDWFGAGSKVIATTRNKHLLASHAFDVSQTVRELNDDEALELFSWHTFKMSCPSSGYLDLSMRVVYYCEGLPLALRVLGKFLCSVNDRSKFRLIWDDYENFYLDKGIQDPLRISYDGLEEEVKRIFLFISCCFVREDIDEVKKMLEACGILCLEKGITKLMNLSLLSINEDNEVEMHDLIQQMGRTIHLFETSHERKRLLIEDDAMDVLNGNEEAREVKVIRLKFPDPTKFDIDSRAFEKVKNLAVLNVENVTLSKTLDFLPSSLRRMIWRRYSFSSLPSSFAMDNLIELSLPLSSIIKFEKGFMNCERLKHIDLTGSIFLEEIPDLSGAVNLEELNLLGCENLVKVHESVGCLNKLAVLELSSHVDGYKQFPRVLKLKSLKVLKMETCNIVEWYPHFSEEMKYCNLDELDFRYCTVTNLSPTIGHLMGLKKLSIYQCEELTTLPTTIGHLTGLKKLSIVYCRELTTLPNTIGQLTGLKELEIIKCEKLTTLPSTIGHLTRLKELKINDGRKLTTLPSTIEHLTGLKELSIIDFKELRTLPSTIGHLTGLKKLLIIGCSEFTTLPSTIGYLTGLKELAMRRCRALTTLPNTIEHLTGLKKLEIIECKNLTTLPTTIGHLTGLEKLLIIDGRELTTLPNTIGYLTGLKVLEITRCKKLATLPSTIGHLTGLKKLLIIDCKELTTLPNTFEHLTVLEKLAIVDCGKLTTLPSTIGHLTGLKDWVIIDCGKLTTLPSTIGHLTGLKKLSIIDCKELTTLPNTILHLTGVKEFAMSNCGKLLTQPSPTLLSTTEQRMRQKEWIMDDCRKITTLSSAIGYQMGLAKVFTIDREKLTTIPNTIGHLTG